MPAAPLGTDTVEHEVRIAARQETVFRYFTDPARMVEWFGAEAILDPRPGGICRITFASSPRAFATLVPLANPQATAPLAPEPLVMSGRFVEVEPYHRLVFTWGWEQRFMAVPPQSTLVTVMLEPDGDAGTILRVVHGRLPETSKAFHVMGWEHYLLRLAGAAAGRRPGPDPFQRAR
jgi:uncharacterized protein YndB with AHSA1/START domain